MKINENSLYKDDINYVVGLNLPWTNFSNCAVLITGASGMIGSFLIDVLMELNNKFDLNCHIYAVGRNINKAKVRFSYYWDNRNFSFITYDVNMPINKPVIEKVDYIIHLASNTHPVAYATDPIGTITTNIIGLYNLLEFATTHRTKRFVYASSNEIYGENRGDVEFFDEKYCGYIDCNTIRAGYPESKRCGEALCQAYIKQKGLDIVISRLTRSFGATLLKSDTKALSQFLNKGVNGENIVLKSAGTQYYSYTYVADAVAGLLVVLLKGRCGGAYNIADASCDIMLKDLAKIIADVSGTKVVFEIPDEIEKAGYSTATKARLCGDKLKELGWDVKYNISDAISRTLHIIGCLK